MLLHDPAVTEMLTRRAAYESLLQLAGKHILELGCGNAELTREIATRTPRVQVTALEVDRIQHEKNRNIHDLPNVIFAYGGAEAIPAPDAVFDVVLMFHSLHHVPAAQLDRALREIHRVLKPCGLAYFEEPVFAGEYCEMTRIFHDEQAVRESAFLALQQAADSGVFEMVVEKFFLTPRHFNDWGHFERTIRGKTHTEHHLSEAQWDAVRSRFEKSMTAGGATFLQPIRVDLMRRPPS